MCARLPKGSFAGFNRFWIFGFFLDDLIFSALADQLNVTILVSILVFMGAKPDMNLSDWVLVGGVIVTVILEVKAS